jgi:NAD(P)-dependent dehydrogenase (short-subunit alcohol dehydrogenase family)
MRRLAPSEEGRQKIIDLLPLQRFGKKEDISQLALFLASDAASYITGSIMVCDGGQSLLGGGALMAALSM